MTSYFYRFRSARALLEGFHELDAQEIYFSRPQDLNDPLEGFKDIFWRGDAILWSNLLRNYLLCLMQTVSVAAFCGADYVFSEDLSFVFHTEDVLPTPELKDRYRRACAMFFDHPDIADLPRLLAGRGAPVRRNELYTYLRAIHFHALNAVLHVLQLSHHIFDGPAANPLTAATQRRIPLKEMFDGINRIELEHPERPDFAEVMSASVDSAYMQTDLINAYNGVSAKVGPAWRMILSDFPRRHIAQLERLLYTNWYTACFVKDPMQAAMWGNYADSHKGVCLKFQAQEDPRGRPILNLTRIVGWHGDKRGATPSYDKAPHEFHEVDYAKRFIEIDFFRSLGAITMPMLKHWFGDVSGEVSEIGRDLREGSADWRDQYWNAFRRAITTKLTDWAHEREFRLVLHSSLTDFGEPSRRKIRYDFGDLQGIIFGMNTTEADKLEIIKIIEQKCRKEGRSDFEFFQSYYSPSTGQMQSLPLRLIKFASGAA